MINGEDVRYQDLILDKNKFKEHGSEGPTGSYAITPLFGVKVPIIADNLVQKDFLLKLSKLNRNFLVLRGLSPRELLLSSKLMAEYMYQLLSKENRSVWIAQREGRTKDGKDATHQGVLKMIAMASDEENCMDFFKKLKIVLQDLKYH
jgi:hypothetical protein